MTGGELIITRAGNIGSIKLNRPQALNSLTLGMVRGMMAALDAFEAESGVIAVFVAGAGERGLCAGGDIRGLYDMRSGDHTHYKSFWREEYRLNARIAAFPKPYVVAMDGVVMGGGVGVSAHGSHRLVTERTRLAMPETGIGFIPDVGGTWLLTRRAGVGRYLALCGATVGGADAIYAGLADLMIDSERIDELERALTNVASGAQVDDVLEQFALPAPQAPLAAHAALLECAMTMPTVEDVIATLSATACEFAQQASASIASKSPTSLKVTHALLARAAQADCLERCLINEFRAACSLLNSHDLYEGIRAAIIDKDRNPRWRPATLGEVEESTVSSILAGTGDQEPAFEERTTR